MKKYFAELFGTFVLVLMGCGSAVFNGGATSVAAVLTIACAFGLSVVAMAYTIGPVSGCHINPAITLGVWLTGGIKAKDALLYMVFQFAGAFLASTLLDFLSSSLGFEGTGANQFTEGNMIFAFVAEAVFTFIFVWVVLATTRAKENTGFAGLIIGLSLILIHIVCIPITGTSVNPARSFGPAIYAGGEALSQLWVFIAAPFAGAAIAALVWSFINAERERSRR